MKRATLLVGQIVPLVVHDEVDDCPVGQGRRLIKDETTLLDASSERAHGATLWLWRLRGKYSGSLAKASIDDLRTGQQFVSGTHTIDNAQIARFAQEFDPQPFHLDADAATFGPFGGLTASGWHTAAITMRLIVEGVPVAGGIVSAGGEIAWTKPVRPGDTLRVHAEIIEIKPSRSRPDRGIVTIRCETRNQNDEPVQVFVAKIVVPRRADATR